MENREKIIISYNKIYTVEQKLYTIGNIKLPQPVQMHTAIAFLCVVMLVFIITSIIPIPIPGTVKYMLIPYLIAKKATTSKRDGKTLYKYYMAYVPYLFQKKIELERFDHCENLKKIQFFK